MDAFWAAPPVTRTLAASIFAISILAAIGILSPYYLVYHSQYILKPIPEIWRLVSAFLLTFQFGIIMDPFFIWSYGVPLETASSRFNSASFFTYIVFVCSVVILLAGEVLGSPVLLGPLSLAITYTFAQENRGQRIQFIVVPMDVKWLPYARLALTFVMSGPQNALVESMGIIAAHLYDFLTIYWPDHGGGSNYIQTPGFVNRLFFGNTPPPRPAGHFGNNLRAAGVDTRIPPNRRPAGQAAGSSTGWNARGPGRRLGD